MDFSLDEEQLALRELAGRIFGDRVSDRFLAEFSRGQQVYDETLWATLAEQGLLGLTAPASLGGSGLGFTELCLLLEQQGRWLAPVPLLATLVLGALPIQQFGSAQQQRQWLTPLIAGEAKFTAAIAELGMSAALDAPVSASLVDGQWLLNGERGVVPDAVGVDYILVPARDGEGQLGIFVVAAAGRGVTLRPEQIGILGHRAAHLTLTAATLPATALLGSMGQGEAILEWLEQYANVAHCALQVGVTEEAMKRTAAYLGERKQFGAPLGSFQALAMRMADCYIDVEAMRSVYWLALWRLSQGLDARLEVRAAKWWACDAAHRVVCTSQHLHGGIGADLEYSIHRFFLWAKQIAYSLGNATTQLDKLGALLAADDTLGYRALEV